MSLKLNEFDLDSPPSDPVSSLNFSPFDSISSDTNNDASASTSSSSRTYHLLVSSWDSTLRRYRIQITPSETQELDPQTPTQQKVEILNEFKAEAPILDACWINQNTVASGGIDRRVRLHNLQTSQSQILGKHKAPISRIRYHPKNNLLFTTSWDSSFSIYALENLEAPELLVNLSLPDKVLAMDLSCSANPKSMIPDNENGDGDGNENENGNGDRIVIGMTGRTVHIYKINDLAKAARESRGKKKQIQERLGGEGEAEEMEKELKKLEDSEKEDFKPEQRRESSLKFMLRDIRCMPNGEGYATSSVEGRIAVEFFDPSPEIQQKKYAFKCHRQTIQGIDTVYPVNNISFHPRHGTFLSLGGDAVLSIWDALAKKRIKQFPKFPSPLTCGGISWDGSLMVIASGGENIEDTRSEGIGKGEVGGMGQGGEGKVKITVKAAWEDCLPKAKPSTAPAPSA